MNRRLSHGFTLVELLVVIVIIGLLLALLLPGLRSVWQMARLSKCKANLNHIWQAQNTRRADQGTQLFATGSGWVSVLLPYLEGDKDTFVCPAGAQAEGAEAPKIPPSNNYYIENYYSGWLKYTINLVPTLTSYEDPKRFLVEPQSDGTFLLIYEDWNNWSYDDLILQIWPPSTGRFRVDIRSIKTNNVFKFFKNSELIVTVRQGSHPWPLTVVDEPLADLLTSDYGMSRGVYETPTLKVARIDPRLIFILDYPQEIADYSCTPDDWPQFFIKDPAEWKKAYGKAASEWGYSWSNFQSLRHFGRANVLFCDGSVETVGVDAFDTATPDEVLSGRYLDETNPLWKYQGN